MPKEELENDLCRCCHSEGVYRKLYETYSWLDVEEVVYSKMLQECFNFEIAPVKQPLQNMLCSICETCIERLQDAVKFKRQVQKCEKRFRDVYGSCVGEVHTFEVKIKQEKLTEDDIKDDTLDTSANEVNSKTIAMADSFRLMDDDADDDGFSGRDDDDSKGDKDFAVRVKEEAQESDSSEDDMFLNQIGKSSPSPSSSVRKRKTAPAAKKKKVAKKNSELGSDDEEGVEVVQGVTIIRIELTPVRRDVDYKEIGDEFQCLACAKIFKMGSSLRRHVRNVHFKLAYYKCPTCFESFHTLEQLRKHKFIKHNIDNRFKCNACDKPFYNKVDLKNHSGLHRLDGKIKCKECAFETYLKYNFARHQVMHSNKRKHKCQYCPKTFKRRTTLRYHERAHTGDKRQVCTECGQAFVQRAGLKYHMIKHHPGVDF